MAKQYAFLNSIENDREITKETDYEFLHNMQSGLLLALKEHGRLNESQYRYAQSRLNRQRSEWYAKPRQKGENR